MRLFHQSLSPSVTEIFKNGTKAKGGKEEEEAREAEAEEKEVKGEIEKKEEKGEKEATEVEEIEIGETEEKEMGNVGSEDKRRDMLISRLGSSPTIRKF